MIEINWALKTVEKAVRDLPLPIIDLMQAQTAEVWKILVATILTARTKDEVTAVVVRKLFAKINSINDLKKFSENELAELIFPVGFYNEKAKYLKKLPDVLAKEFAEVIPNEIEELIKLPGVGRKTANLVMAVGFGKPAICVDTHVHRIMNIWQYVKTKNPLETEMALRGKLPKKYWLMVNRILVSFGQSICRPVSPHCNECPLNIKCPKMQI